METKKLGFYNDIVNNHRVYHLTHTYIDGQANVNNNTTINNMKEGNEEYARLLNEEYEANLLESVQY